MEWSDDLEEVFSLAYQNFPIQTEYHLTRILMSMPKTAKIVEGRVGRNEYELDELPIFADNIDRKKLENFISKLRSSKI